MKRIAFVGNPNAGKSTLFNALTGRHVPTGNYPGITVSLSRAPIAALDAMAVDVPGAWSLAARSPEERIAVEVVLGRAGQERPDVVVAVVDAPRLARALYLVLQLLELGVPIVVALNMMDEARASGVAPDVDAVGDALGVPVVPIVARSGEGLDALLAAVREALANPTPSVAPHRFTEVLDADADEVAAALDGDRALGRWALLSTVPEVQGVIDVVHARACEQGRDLTAEIVGQRYAWIDARMPGFVGGVLPDVTVSDRVDRVLLHPVSGSLVFVVVMGLVFQTLFAWADPLIGAVETVFGWLGDGAGAAFAALQGAVPAGAGAIGLLSDLVTEGIIGGVGSILVFLPQIALLFFFIALLEDSGYLARAAHLMDRVLRAAGLPGRAFVPLLSGFACAVPAVMATRTLPRFRDRLLTMMVIPLTSCSARLPVYTLLIAALFPAVLPGVPLSVQALALLAMYLLSTVVTLLAAIVLGKLVLPDTQDSATLELPPYRWPHPTTVARSVYGQASHFVREAGGVILVATIVLWALLSFPRYEPAELLPAEVIATHSAAEVEAMAAPMALERSFGGRLGKAVEPAIRPLGYDWQIGVGILGAFAAREVFVSTMGLVYGIGEVDEADAALHDRIRAARHPDGRKVYTPLVGASLMVFFAFAMQCTSTLAVLYKETGGWKWPSFALIYMTVLAWISAFVVYQGGLLLGLG